MLDWYFDCDDEQHSLRELLKRSTAAHSKAPSQASGGTKATPRKLERYAKADRPDGGQSCYVLFQGLLAAFRLKVQTLAEARCKGDPTDVEACDEGMIWVRHTDYALDSCPSNHPNPRQFQHSVWLGLGRLEDGFRKPVAFKRNDEDEEQQAKLVRMMRKLKPGSFIASAELVEVGPLNKDVEPPTPMAVQKRWVSEAGVCTLEELFGRVLTPNDITERKTKAHRMLVKEILHSMALAVFHLHECKIAHTSINLRYFKVFLIEEPPRSTNLRVKLVSMRRADTLTPVREREDIEDLGKAMARVVLGESGNMEELLSYDPSLYWLVAWILDESDGATLADVIRHPYFMSLNEKEVFTLALEGDIFGEILTIAEVTHLPPPLPSYPSPFPSPPPPLLPCIKFTHTPCIFLPEISSYIVLKNSSATRWLLSRQRRCPRFSIACSIKSSCMQRRAAAASNLVRLREVEATPHSLRQHPPQSRKACRSPRRRRGAAQQLLPALPPRSTTNAA
jgi:hypothetical protein